MAQRRVVLESRLLTIERRHDVVALGAPEQQESWRALSELEPNIARLARAGQAEELRGKHRFLKGLLLWDLERDYKARLWEQKKQLRRLDAEIREAQQRHRAVSDARDDWPERFADMTARIESLEPRLEAIREAARLALARQYRHLEALALAELDERRRRLQAYRVQARYSLAAVYDRAADAGAPRDSRAADAGAPRDSRAADAPKQRAARAIAEAAP